MEEFAHGVDLAPAERSKRVLASQELTGRISLISPGFPHHRRNWRRWPQCTFDCIWLVLGSESWEVSRSEPKSVRLPTRKTDASRLT
jgi:hypothetical protein